MPRRPRVFVEGGSYHVYNRFARGAEVFREGDEGERFVELLRRACERDGPGFRLRPTDYAVTGRRWLRRGSLRSERSSERRLGREPDRPLAPEPPVAWIDEIGVSTGLERATLELQRFLEMACDVLGVAPAAIADRGSSREITRARCLVMAVGVERWRQSTKGLAELMGRRADVVSRWVRWPGFAFGYAVAAPRRSPAPAEAWAPSGDGRMRRFGGTTSSLTPPWMRR